MKAPLALLAAVCCLLAASCGRSQPAAQNQASASSTTKATASARSLAPEPPDFSGVTVQVCAAPHTGDFATYLAAYRPIKRRDSLTTMWQQLQQLGLTDSWVQSLATQQDWCKGSLGFDYAQGVMAAPIAVSYVFTFRDETSATKAYQTAAPLLFKESVHGDATGFGPNASLNVVDPIYYSVWQRKRVVIYLLCQDVPSCKQAGQAVDARVH